MTTSIGATGRTDIAEIGTGFGGIGMEPYLREAAIRSFAIFEKGGEVGGVWRENTYPGAGCDVPSHFDACSFARRHPWTYRYARQSGIVDHLKGCARADGLYGHLRFHHEVIGADFDESRGIRVLRFANGRRHEAQFVISAVGQLHRPSIPAIPGPGRFRGHAFHSAEWHHDLDLTGKRIAMIGTGASAVQFLPGTADAAERVHVSQRSPGWAAPKFEKPFTPLEHTSMNRFGLLKDLDRVRTFLLTEALGFCYRGHEWAMRLVTWVPCAQIRLQVRDPALRAKLTPDFPIGCKRILLTAEWLPTLTRPDVDLVTDGIHEITPEGLVTADGRKWQVGAIIYGTGFAATEFLAPMTIRHPRAQPAGAARGLVQHRPGIPRRDSVPFSEPVHRVRRPPTHQSGLRLHRVHAGTPAALHRAHVAAAGAARPHSHVEVRESAERAYNAWLGEHSHRSTFEGDCQSWYKNTAGMNINSWVGSQLEHARPMRAPEPATTAWWRPARISGDTPHETVFPS